VGNGPPPAQRRACIEYLSRELRALEIEASHSRALQDRVDELEARVKRAEGAAQMWMRRCDMLEAALLEERQSKGGASSSLAAAAALLPPPPEELPRCGILPAETPPALVPSPPTSLPPSSWSSSAASLALPPATTATTLGDEEDDFDIDALIAAQQAMPVPKPAAGAGGLRREPIRVRVAGSGETAGNQAPT